MFTLEISVTILMIKSLIQYYRRYFHWIACYSFIFTSDTRWCWLYSLRWHLVYFLVYSVLMENSSSTITVLLKLWLLDMWFFMTLLFIAGSSYERERIPNEIFYALHHVVFIMFAITVAHTLDDVQSDTPKERSQSFKWFFTYLMFYTCD